MSGGERANELGLFLLVLSVNTYLGLAFVVLR
jgi:hypothetical protein